MFQHLNIGTGFMRILAQVAAPLTRARNPLEQTKHMAGDMAEIGTIAQLALNVRVHRTHDRNRIGVRAFDTKDFAIDRRQNARF